jgi:hypothetical protein
MMHTITVSMRGINGLQLKQLYNHIEVAREMGWQFGVDGGDAWSVSVDGDGEFVTLTTDLDAFDMLSFLRHIGVEQEAIENDSATKDGELH